MIKPWPTVASKKVGDYRIFTIRSDRKTSPRTGKDHEFYVIETVPWVNVIAITKNQQIILVEQYRHGSNSVELEIPGGMLDPHEDCPIAAGQRELREETGYEGDHALLLGEVLPNPAIMNNVCSTVLVQNCELRHPTVFDHSEDLITRLAPVEQIPQLISSHAIRHSLVIVALYHYQMWRSRCP